MPLVGGVLLIVLLAGLAAPFLTAKRPRANEALTWTVLGVILLAIGQWMGAPVAFLPLPAIPMTAYPANLIIWVTGISWLIPVGGVICLAVALLSDELFEVDIVINKALVYGILSVLVVAIYGLVVGYLSLVFQSSGILWFSLLATGLTAVLFQPLRMGVQRFVNQMLYGKREDPYSVLARLGRRLETTLASDEVYPTILQTVREALQLPYAAILIKTTFEDQYTIAAESGQHQKTGLILPISYQHATVGELRLSQPLNGDFSAADQRLLADIAQQAGIAVHAAQLNADLQSARQHLVIAQEEERRRIRRDLHDGLGASLAVLNLQAGEVQRLINSDPETATQRISDVRAGIRTAIGDIRRLVYGLRPPALDELGLIDALCGRIAQYQSSP